MMKDRTLNHIRDIIRKGLYEDVPTNSVSTGVVKDIDKPPVDLRKNKFKKLPGPYRDLFRRKVPSK